MQYNFLSSLMVGLRRGVVCILIISCLPVYARQMQELPAKGITQYDSKKIQVTGKNTTIQLKQDQLREVLQSLVDTAGIRFFVNSELFKVPMSGEVKGEGWTATIKELLRDFNIKEVYQEKDQLKAVFVQSLKKQHQPVYARAPEFPKSMPASIVAAAEAVKLVDTTTPPGPYGASPPMQIKKGKRVPVPLVAPPGAFVNPMPNTAPPPS